MKQPTFNFRANYLVLKTALGCEEDLQMASHLGVDAITMSKVIAGRLELPTHAMAIMLEKLGLLEVTDLTLQLLTKVSRKKYLATRERNASLQK
jgi:hypothetical protein